MVIYTYIKPYLQQWKVSRYLCRPRRRRRNYDLHGNVWNVVVGIMMGCGGVVGGGIKDNEQS
jgi:hypothetical protein